jgi:hypothetical protein
LTKQSDRSKKPLAGGFFWGFFKRVFFFFFGWFFFGRVFDANPAYEGRCEVGTGTI